MKKTLLIALAGLMMFAFTQCGSKGNDKANENKKETKVEEAVSEQATKQFNEMKSAYDEIGKMIEDCTSCDQLEEATFALALGTLAISLGSDEYADEEKMTEKEQKNLEDIIQKLTEKAEKKAEKLGCEKKEYSL
jgi:hypothetical protein